MGSSGNEPNKNPATFKSAYQDWDYTSTGRYMAEVQSLTPTDTITQKEAEAINVKRIKQFADCFASFSPAGGAPIPAQKKITGTVTGLGFTHGAVR